MLDLRVFYDFERNYSVRQFWITRTWCKGRKVLNPLIPPTIVFIYSEFITYKFHLPTHIRDYVMFRLILYTFQDDVKPRISALFLKF